MQKFFKGLMDKGEKHSYIPRQYQTDLNTAINTNNLIDNVYFLSDSQASITTTQTSEDKLLSAYKETIQGQMISLPRTAAATVFESQSILTMQAQS